MKNILILTLIISCFCGCLQAQSFEQTAPSDLDTPVQTVDAQVLELIAVFNDAIDFPTKYNEYVIPIMQEATFPVKQNLSKQEYDTQLEKWINENPLKIEEFKVVRQKAHDELYGPRK